MALQNDDMVAFSLERTLQEKPLSDNAIDFQGVIYTKMAILSHTELYVNELDIDGLGRCTECNVIRLVVGTNLTSPPHQYTQKTHFLDLCFKALKFTTHKWVHPYTHQ